MNLNQALMGIRPGSKEWFGSSIYDTWYREQGDWCAIVYPSEQGHRPGWGVDVWLRLKGPNEPGNLLTHGQVASESAVERTNRSREQALRMANSMLERRVPAAGDSTEGGAER
jgi:hypothetical protein